MNLHRICYYELPTVMKHGLGSINALPQELNRLQVKRPFIVTDQGIVASSIIDQVLEPLKADVGKPRR